MLTRFHNCRLITPESVIVKDLWVEDGKFVNAKIDPDVEIDLQGMYVAPGYIDLQINGGYGYDFTTDPQSIETVAKKITEKGVTSFCPTIISSPSQHYQKLPEVNAIDEREQSAHILGYHLEGPFINAEYAGAHERVNIQSFPHNSDNHVLCPCLSSTRIITVAPEIKGAVDWIDHLSTQGVVVAMGHTGANEKEYIDAVKAGARMVTHLFNAMEPFHHRHPGIIGALFTRRDSFFSMIVDGVHVHPTAVKLAWEMHSKGMILVSDAMAGMGLADGEYYLGGQHVSVVDGKAVVSGTETLAGSIVSLDQCIRNLINITSCTLPEAINTVTITPASLLGLYPQKGSLQAGADADFVVLDEGLNVQKTCVSGALIKNL
jgi:N-acetylglucosamine-6-phosphate deacetylase